jgi:hypothetical protein
VVQINLPAIATNTLVQAEKHIKIHSIQEGPDEMIPLFPDLLLFKRQSGADSMECLLWRISEGKILDRFDGAGRFCQTVWDKKKQTVHIYVFSDGSVGHYLVNFGSDKFECRQRLTLTDWRLCCPPVPIKDSLLMLAQDPLTGQKGQRRILSWRPMLNWQPDSIPAPSQTLGIRPWQEDYLLFTHRGIALYEPIYHQIKRRWEDELGMGLLTHLEMDTCGPLIAVPYQNSNNRVSVAVLSKIAGTFMTTPPFYAIEAAPRLWGKILYILARQDAASPVKLFGYGM